jgi:aminoglycoside phosphotransferase (APT) family kinase protein
MPPSLGQPIATGRTAEVFAWEDGTVLKLYYEWCPRRWRDEELRVARLVHEAGLAVPAPGEAVEINGRVGLIYERVDGPSMLEEMVQKRFVTLWRSARQMAELHVAISNCAVPGLGSAKDGLAHAIRSPGWLPDDLRQPLLQRLERLPDGDCLCHADFHPGNIVMTGHGPIVIDWMTAARGDPMADVARSILLLSMGPPLNRLQRLGFNLITWQFRAAYLKRYFELHPAGRDRLAAWQPIIAAARMNEKIEGEREKLMEMVRRGLAARPQAGALVEAENH